MTIFIGWSQGVRYSTKSFKRQLNINGWPPITIGLCNGVVYSADISFKVRSQEFLLIYSGIMEKLENMKHISLKKMKHIQ